MRFSMVLASRDRVPLLKGLCESLMQTTNNPEEIEILTVFDEDDLISNSAIPHLTQQFSRINFQSFVRPRSEWMHRDYINWVCPHARGKYVIVLNDDTRFVNPGWDDLAWGKLEGYMSTRPDGIVYGFTDTFSKDSSLCCFPLVSKKAIEVLGFFLPNERKNWSADRDVYSLYTHPMINRKLDLPEIKIQHVAYHSGLRERDAVSFRIEQIFIKEPYINVPILSYADRLASHMRNKSNHEDKNKVLVVYNICGISRYENVDYYLSAIYSILHQKFDKFRVVVSGCLSSEATKKCLTDNLEGRVSFNWIDEKLPLNVTFNHSAQRCTEEFGAFENYLYVDSGVTFGNNRNVIKIMYDKMSDYGMITAKVDLDSGYGYWGINLVPGQDYIVPVGKTCNLHCQMFSSEVYKAYNNKILPDIFAHHTSESVFTFMNACINRKWAIIHDFTLHHESNMDGASSGFLNVSGLLFKSPKPIEQICSQGKQYGLGYEEVKNICVHIPAKFDDNGYARDSQLLPFIRDNLFLSKSSFDYGVIQHNFVNEIKREETEIPSPQMTCILVSHNKPEYVKEAVESLLSQECQDWQGIIIDSGVLGSEFFSYINDPRIQVIVSDETEELRRSKAMAPWCFNEAFRRGLVKGHLIMYLCDDDILYPNAFSVFTEYKKNNFHVHAMYASQDYAVHTKDERVIVGERRAIGQRGLCVNGSSMDCKVDYLQFCHTREVLDWLPNKTNYWSENKDTESHADGIFMDNVGRIVPIYPIDIKVSQNRRTPISLNKPSR